MRTSTAETEARELVFSRTFNAPRSLVWEAWTDPKHIAAWWGPQGFKASVNRLELKVGGTFLLHMQGPDGRMWPCKGIYREISEPERIVYRGEADDGHACGGGLPPRATVTVTFSERDGQTTVTIHTALESAADRDAAIAMGFREGWAASLESLNRHLSKMA